MPAATPITLASLRLIMKRLVIRKSFSARCHAIGSEVAAETSRSAERNVPARTVAVLRAEANVLSIGRTLFQFPGPDHRARAIVNAGVVPIGNSRCFSMTRENVDHGSA